MPCPLVQVLLNGKSPWYLPFTTGSGRAFSGFGIWPKYGAGIVKMINILTGSGIWLFPGKRDSPKIGHGMRDLCLRVCRECRKPLKTRVNSKYQSKGSTYILHLLAFVEIRLFNVFFWGKKAVFGKLMKNVGDAGFSRKRGGNVGSGPPFQTLLQLGFTWLKGLFMVVVTCIAGLTCCTLLLSKTANQSTCGMSFIWEKWGNSFVIPLALIDAD